MNAAELRLRMLMATIVLKTLEPHLAKYGIDLKLDDVLDAFILAGGAWHYAVPYLKRFLPSPKAEPAQPGKE